MYKPPNIAAVIKARAKEQNVVLKVMLNDLELSSNTMSSMYHGKMPAADSLARIADYLKCSVDYLLGRVTDPSAKTNKTIEAQFTTPGITEDYVTFPVIGDVAAGYDHIAYQDWTEGAIDIPKAWLHGRPITDFFVIKVKGDSMYPDYQDGDYVLILRQSTMDRSGQVGIVRYNEEIATLKRVEYVMGEDWMTLRPINPQFPPITIRDEDLTQCTVFGVAKYIIRELRQ